MAQAKDNKTTTRKKRWQNLRELWNQDGKTWVEFLETKNSHGASVAGERVKLCCPYHDDRSPSAEIHLTKGHFRCYSSRCNRYEWDPIKFLSHNDNKVFGFKSYGEALKEFKSFFNAKIPRNVLKEYEEDFAHRQRMRWVAKCAQLKLDEAWQNPHNTEAAQLAVDWLKARGISDSTHHGSIGLWPRLSDITAYVRNSGGSDDDLNAIRELFGTYFDIKYQDWVVFIYATDPSNPTAFKIRKPLTAAQVKALGDKPIFFLGEKNGVKGFFGMMNPAYAPLIGDSKYKEAFLTEGEMDALSVYENQVVTGQCDAIFLAAGGSGHNGADDLLGSGISQANVIGDDDDGGAGFLEGMLEKTHECAVRLFVWPDSLKHPSGQKMDPDSAIAQFGFIATMNEFYQAKNFIYPHTWAYDVASGALSKTASDDVRSQTEIAKSYAIKLHHNAERQEFLNLVNRAYSGVSPIEVKRAISDDEDNHLSTVKDIVQKILARYHLHYWDPATRRLSLWDKKQEFCFEIEPSRADSISFMVTQLCYGDVYSWIRDEIGLPGYLPPIEGKDAVPNKGRMVINDLRWCLEEALLRLPPLAPQRPSSLKGQGIHLEKVRETSHGYLVSGNRMYEIAWQQDGTALEKVTPLDGPSCKEDVFLVNRTQMSRLGDWADPIFTCEADFFRAPKWSAKETLDHVFKIINEYWRFRHQVADARMLAAYPFYSYMLDAFKRRVQIHLLGEAESGKSSLLSMIAGGQQLHDYRLTQCAHTEMDATVSGLLQFYPGARMVVGLDELNDPNDGTPHSNKIKQLYVSLRGLAMHGSTTRLRGSAHFVSNTSDIGIATVTASGTRIFDPMDATRFKTVNLTKDATLGSVAARLANDFDPEFWPQLRHAIAYHSIHNAMAIAALADTIEKENVDPAKLPIKSSRFREGLYPLAAIVHQFGWDGHDFLYDFCKAREEEERETSRQTRGQDIFEAVLNIPTFSLDGERDHREVTIGEMLVNPSWRDNISSIPGVYLDSPTQTLAISWSHMEGHLRRLGGFYSSLNMQTIADSCRLYVDPSRSKRDGSLARFRNSGLLSSRFSIFNVSEYLAARGTVTTRSTKSDDFDISVDDDASAIDF